MTAWLIAFVFVYCAVVAFYIICVCPCKSHDLTLVNFKLSISPFPIELTFVLIWQIVGCADHKELYNSHFVIYLQLSQMAVISKMDIFLLNWAKYLHNYVILMKV